MTDEGDESAAGEIDESASSESEESGANEVDETAANDTRESVGSEGDGDPGSQSDDAPASQSPDAPASQSDDAPASQSDDAPANEVDDAPPSEFDDAATGDDDGGSFLGNLTSPRKQLGDAAAAFRNARGAGGLPRDDEDRVKLVCRRHAERRAVPLDDLGRPACFDAGHPDCEGCLEDVRDGTVETW